MKAFFVAASMAMAAAFAVSKVPAAANSLLVNGSFEASTVTDYIRDGPFQGMQVQPTQLFNTAAFPDMMPRKGIGFSMPDPYSVMAS